MKRCLNTITLGSDVAFSDSVIAASHAGFDGIEIFSLDRARKYAESSSVADLNSMFDQLKIQPVGFVLGGFVYQRKAEFSQNLPGIAETLTFAGEIGAENALIFIPSKGGLEPQEAVQIATERVGEVVDLAAGHGVRIGLEPIGQADFLNTPRSLTPVLEAIDSAALGLTIDIFHYYMGGCTTSDLRGLPPEKIFFIHVDDAPDLPHLDDSKRVFPGKGAMDVVGFIRTLKEVGFDGPLSVELFNRDLWASDPRQVALSAKEALESVMREAGST